MGVMIVALSVIAVVNPVQLPQKRAVSPRVIEGQMPPPRKVAPPVIAVVHPVQLPQERVVSPRVIEGQMRPPRKVAPPVIAVVHPVQLPLRNGSCHRESLKSRCRHLERLHHLGKQCHPAVLLSLPVTSSLPEFWTMGSFISMRLFCWRERSVTTTRT